MLQIYTDGSFRKKENIGGYGVVVVTDNTVIYVYQHQYKNTTNNRMELAGILHACAFADKFFPKEDVVIYSDSAYCVNSINNWMYTWIKNSWKNSKKEEVKNMDLIKIIYQCFNKDFYHCTVERVEAHCGNIYNELADSLATKNKNKFIKISEKNNLQFDIAESFNVKYKFEDII